MKRQSIGGKIFDVFNNVFLLLCLVVTVFPFYNVLVTSLITRGEFFSRPLILIPKKITLSSYKYIFSSGDIMNSLLVTAFITVVGTALSMVVTVLLAYALSKKFLPGRSLFTVIVLLTMFFDGGLVPFYLLIRSLGLIDNLFVNILPVLVNAWFFIIIKSFFHQTPVSLEESAIIDGANYFTILIRIVLPVSKPVLATFVLFYGVTYWNTWWFSLLFVNNADLHPLQLLLRRMVVDLERIWGMASRFMAKTGDSSTIYEDGVKMATCIIAVIPIICVYPFLQKYFVKGIMLGAIKG